MLLYSIVVCFTFGICCCRSAILIMTISYRYLLSAYAHASRLLLVISEKHLGGLFSVHRLLGFSLTLLILQRFMPIPSLFNFLYKYNACIYERKCRLMHVSDNTCICIAGALV